MANQIIVSEDRNQITVVEGETRIVEVVTQGPQGPVGPSGPAGPSGSSILNQITSGSVTASVDIGPTIFSLTSGSSTYLAVSSSGNVGIGTTTPTSRLYILDTGSEGRIVLEHNRPSGGIYFFRNAGTAQNPIAVGNTFELSAGGWDGTQFTYNRRTSIRVAAAGAWNSGSNGGWIIFQTVASGSIAPFIQAIITDTGNFVSAIDANLATARGRFHVRGNTTSAVSNSVYIENSSQTNLFTIADNGNTSINGNTTITGSLTVTGNITAQTLVVQTITSSVSFITGSTKFGSLSTNTHQFTGSIFLSGSMGIGTSTPATLFDIYSAANANSSLQVGESQNIRVSINTQSANRFSILTISRIGDGATPAVSIGVGTGPTSTSGVISTNNDSLIFGYNIGNAFTETFRINTSNRLLLGLTTDDTVNRLQVSGSTRLIGGLVVTGSTTITSGLSVGSGATISGQTNINIGAGTNFTLSGALGGSLSYAYAEYIGSTYIAGFVGSNFGAIGTSGIYLSNTGASHTVVITGNKMALGHTNPASLLHISGSTGGLLEVDSPALSNILFVSASGNIGIGTDIPTYALDVNGTFRTTGLSVSTGYSFSVQRLQFNNGTAGSNFGYIIGSANGVFRLMNAAENDFTRLQFGGTTSAFPGLQRVSSSLAIVGADGSTTSSLLVGLTTDDTINRLQVSGSSRFIGSAVISGSTTITSTLSVNSTSNFTGLASFGNVTLNNLFGNGGSITIEPGSSATLIRLKTFANISSFVNLNSTAGSFTVTAGDIKSLVLDQGFAPTTGTATMTYTLINPAINQTGTANGIIRGLYVNPTLTANASWRSIEWSNNASGSTSWGLYGAGTAPNFLSGSLGIGTTSPNAPLTVAPPQDLGSGNYVATFYNSSTAGGRNGLLVRGGNQDTSRVLEAVNHVSTIFLVKGNNSININAPSPTINYATLFLGNAFSGYPTLLVRGNGSSTEVTFQTQNSAGSALLTALDNGNLLLNTTSDSGERLQVSGSSRFVGNMVVTGSITLSGGIGSTNINGNIQAGSSITFLSSEGIISTVANLSINVGPSSALGLNKTNNITATSGEVNWFYINPPVSRAFAPTSGTATMNGILINLPIVQSGGASGITRGLYITPSLTSAWDFRAIEWSHNASATSGSWGLYGAGSAPSYLSGSLNIGTTTLGSNILNVSGSTLLRGGGNTSGTNALNIQNSDAVSIMSFRNDGNIYADGTNFVITKYTSGATTLTVSNTGHNDAVGIRTTSATGLIAVSSLGVSGNNLTGASIYAAGGNANAPTNISLGLLSNRALITSTASGMNMHTSSMLQVDSTSQGFLPPRMTTTQKNAISTPATGLMVYDTTLNKLCVFTTTWETITSA